MTNEAYHCSTLHIGNIGIFGSCGSAIRLRIFYTATYAAAANTDAATDDTTTDGAASDAGADAAAKGFAAEDGATDAAAITGSNE